MLDRLRPIAETARRHGKQLPHLLICAPAGSGKATIAQCIAAEIGTSIRAESGQTIERPCDLGAILTNMERGSVLFIKEIDRLRSSVAEILCPAIEDSTLDLVVGKGATARTMRLPLPPFTLIGGTSAQSAVHDRLARETIRFELAPYTNQEMATIVSRVASTVGLKVAPDAVDVLVRCAAGSPGDAAAIIRKLHRLGYQDRGTVTSALATEGLGVLGYPSLSLNAEDLRTRLRGLSGEDFEREIGDLLRSRGYGVELTRTSGDHGIDLRITHPTRPGKLAVAQCKRWETPIGESHVRDFYGAIIHSGAERGCFVTTSTFTAPAVA